ncbi:MAG: cytochrome c3 family protein, partial [Desulfobulbales bacterium]|nr:cytochrome c3 family protein [Desulfobulbales bacterium]
YTCVGCHAKNTSVQIADVGTLDIPQVFFDDAQPDLAAGNFKHVVTSDASGHNVHGWGLGVFGVDLISPDVSIAEPPGYSSDMDPSGKDFVNDYPFGFGFGGQVLCAGAYGCHGDRTEESQTMATYGAHHADDGVLQFGSIVQASQGQSLGTSYRFLSGVKGGEDDDWEASGSVGPTDHNEYFGADVTVRNSQSSVETMSQFCASCHGIFHMAGQADGTGITPGADLNSPWIRHPTDYLIPDDSPYNNYTSYMQSGSGDDQTVRVARITIPNSPSDDTGISAGGALGGGQGVVFCLSCHKAHASQYPDMLRFSYSLMETNTVGAGVGTGCFACHNDKDGL